jgi:hypothetical protein
MTIWQWQVILALCRLVLGILYKQTMIPSEQRLKDVQLLEEVLRREIGE